MQPHCPSFLLGHRFLFASWSFAPWYPPFRGRLHCIWPGRAKNVRQVLLTSPEPNVNSFIHLRQIGGETGGAQYCDVFDVFRQVGDGLVLLAQLTAEVSGLVNQL